ncbi:MAG: hypothetical protein ACXWP4_20155 [Polyangiales bacterium]
MKTILLFTVALVAAGCGGRAGEPPPPNVAKSSQSSLSPADDKTLDQALALKRSGDVAGAFRLVESLPPDSPARLDNRYDEISSAWSNERAKVVGEEISEGGGPVGIGGGPPAEVSTVGKTRLDTATFERVMEKQRPALRAQCFKPGSQSTDFVLTVDVDSSGMVRDVIIANLKGDRSVADCVRTQSYRWKFPSSTKGGEFTTSLYFRPDL